MNKSFSVKQAAAVLLDGGVIAYPTEGVYGLGCIPDDENAVRRIVAIKGRNHDAGFILIAPDYELLEEWLQPDKMEEHNLRSTISYPVTWIVQAAPAASGLLTGGRKTIAVRISNHPVVRDICNEIGSALVSTSANRSGHRPAKNALQARYWLGNKLDYVISAPLGDATGPSEIRMGHNSQVIRPGFLTNSP